MNYLQWLHESTATRWWHDSAIPAEIDAALKLGALGITTNPVLTFKSLNTVPQFWAPQIKDIPPDLHGVPRAEALLRAIASYAAEKLLPIFDRTQGAHGYAFGQLNPDYAGDRKAMLEQALRYASWAENLAVKLPTTGAAIPVIEELASRGIAICATLNFSVSQAVAVADAYQRGCERAGKATRPCFVVQQGGRLEDYLRMVAADQELGIDEETILQAGNALVKKTMACFAQRGYTARIMPAGLRQVRHLTELAGAPLVFSLHPRIQKMVLEADPEKRERCMEPVDEKVIARLRTIPEFRRAYDDDALPTSEFVTFGVTQKTLAQFLETGWSPLENFGSKATSKRWT
ncbi:MAG: hypothetical protein GX946_04075 [Oligosphaeraceae bacterium]|nr:hypothetical protein [Oligosphaeraceae bacterium]